MTSSPDPLWRRIADVAYVLCVAVAQLIWLPVAEAIAARIRPHA